MGRIIAWRARGGGRGGDEMVGEEGGGFDGEGRNETKPRSQFTMNQETLMQPFHFYQCTLKLNASHLLAERNNLWYLRSKW